MKVKNLAKIVLIVIVFSGFYIQSMDGVGQQSYNEVRPGVCGNSLGSCIK